VWQGIAVDPYALAAHLNWRCITHGGIMKLGPDENGNERMGY